MSARKRPMRRVGDLLPDAASALGIDEEFRRARAGAAWERAVRQTVPAAAGGSRLVGFRGETAVVEAAAPIVAQELLLHRDELLAAFAATAGGRPAADLRVIARSWQTRSGGDGPHGGLASGPHRPAEPDV